MELSEDVFSCCSRVEALLCDCGLVHFAGVAKIAILSLAKCYTSEFAPGQPAAKPRPALACKVLMKCGTGTEKLTCLTDSESEPLPCRRWPVCPFHGRRLCVQKWVGMGKEG